MITFAGIWVASACLLAIFWACVCKAVRTNQREDDFPA